MSDKLVDCTKCQHFYITWDVKFPRGCKLYGFKSSQYPSNTVREATGKQCDQFCQKLHKR